MSPAPSRSELRLIGDPVLRTPAEAVAPDQIASADIQTLIDDMVATMRAAPGVGMAAPQLGRSLRIVVMEDPAALQHRLTPEQRLERGRLTPFPLTVLINPELRLMGGDRTVFPEGCLSIPGYTALVARASSVEACWVDQSGAPHAWTRFFGWPARILQHEVDHLDGTLCTDRMEPRSLVAVQHAAHLSSRPLGNTLPFGPAQG